ncbi:MAG: DNA-binding protein [Actinobacteria bacterium]|nr:DNA-binding protein [Actinomycetota bacterium]
MAETRIHLCGRLVARIDGHRVENELPGRQGRLLFAYLALERSRPATRDELTEALWPGTQPAATSSALSALLSKLRRVAPLESRGELRLDLPREAWVDVEAAREALHRAQAAVARSDWTATWSAGRVTQHIAARELLPGEEAPWLEERRRELEELYLRSLELVGRASVEIGGGELDTAERCGRRLISRAPFRESGYRLLMEVLSTRGDGAEALLVYDELRHRLRDELGIAPSPLTQTIYKRILA